MPFPIGGHFGTKRLSLTVSEIFNVESDAMIDMTLANVIHFGANKFLMYDFLQAVNSNCCSRTHRLATIHTLVTNDRRTVA